METMADDQSDEGFSVADASPSVERASAAPATALADATNASAANPSGGVSLADFLADAPANAARRAEQEAAWDLDGKEDARQLLYEREAARAYGELVARSVNAFWRTETLARGHGQRGSPLNRLPAELVRRVALWAEGAGADGCCAEALKRREIATAAAPPPRRGVRVYARVRPPSASEAGARSVVDRAAADAAVLHEARLSRSGRTLKVTHHYVAIDGVFAGPTARRSLKSEVIDPLLRRFFGEKKDAALLLFGQTGTGKTHTLKEALDAVVAAAFPGGGGGGGVTARFLELAGKSECRDLLAGGRAVRLLADAEERIHFVGSRSASASTAAELREALDEGMRLRASVATERNAASSRSHALVELARGGAVLTLVDLAGSERKWETMALKSRAASRESALINLSLMALKDCFRAQHARLSSKKGKSTRIPYRASSLTRVPRPRGIRPLGSGYPVLPSSRSAVDSTLASRGFFGTGRFEGSP